MKAVALKLNWKWYLVFFIIFSIIVLRLSLPYFLLDYAEKTLNKIPGYSAKIESVSVNLYRGSYGINKLELNKIKNRIPEPFFSSENIDFSVQWKALLKGHLVAKVIVNKPVVNFVTDPKGHEEQLTIDDQWRSIVTHLFPLNFNQITIKEGKVHFKSFKSSPPFDLSLKSINGTLDNLRDIKSSDKMLPSTVTLQAKTVDGAIVDFKMSFDPFAVKPMFKLAASLEHMNIKDTNNVLQYYTKIRVKKGEFSAYCEAVAAKGQIEGYVKPIFKNLEIKTSGNNPLESLYRTAVSAAASLLENSEKETIATKVKILGNIDEPDTSLLSIIGYLLKHGFIQAFLPGIDHSVKMQDVVIKKV